MAIYRFYLPPKQWLEDSPQLNEAETHHALHVLRLDAGSKVHVFDGEGKEAVAVINRLIKQNGHHAILTIENQSTTPRPACQVTLVQAVPKGKNMDLVIQKAVELGVTRIVPLLSDRTVVRCHDRADSLHKQERWQSIALEACKQSGQNWLPQVELPCRPKDFFTTSHQPELRLIASLEDGARSLKEILALRSTMHSSPPSHVTVAIGPEGDFTQEEYALAKEAGYQSLSLGPIILRTETAALYCLSVLAHELF